VGGYFDGDGSVGVMVVRYVLRFKIRFSDTWQPQIEAIKSFMDWNGISTSSVGRYGSDGQLDAYRVDIGAISSIIKAGRAMLPHCVKKSEDLRIMIDYLEGRTTGNQAIERLNDEVRMGRRSGFMRKLNLPYTRPEGLRVAQLENARRARVAYTIVVSDEIQRQIRSDYQKLKLSYLRLSRKYSYSESVIRRILGAP
jgi:hypothetical protein